MFTFDAGLFIITTRRRRCEQAPLALLLTTGMATPPCPGAISLRNSASIFDRPGFLLRIKLQNVMVDSTAARSAHSLKTGECNRLHQHPLENRQTHLATRCSLRARRCCHHADARHAFLGVDAVVLAVDGAEEGLAFGGHGLEVVGVWMPVVPFAAEGVVTIEDCDAV